MTDEDFNNLAEESEWIVIPIDFKNEIEDVEEIEMMPTIKIKKQGIRAAVRASQVKNNINNGQPNKRRL